LPPLRREPFGASTVTHAHHMPGPPAGLPPLYLLGLQANQRKIVLAARAEDVTRPNP